MVKINVNQEDLYTYCVLIANHKTRLTLDEVEKWLERHTVQLGHRWKKE